MSFLANPLATSPGGSVTIPPAGQIAYGNPTATDLASTARFYYDTTVNLNGDPQVGMPSILSTSANFLVYCEAPESGAATFNVLFEDVPDTGGGSGGRINLRGGNSDAFASAGGDVQLFGGNAPNTGSGGNVLLIGGDGENNGGSVTLVSGYGTGLAGVSGSLFLVTASASPANPTAASGQLQLLPGELPFLSAYGQNGAVYAGFFTATPDVQPTTAIAGASFTANSGANIHVTSTFDGYTVAQVVAALRRLGLLA